MKKINLVFITLLIPLLTYTIATFAVDATAQTVAPKEIQGILQRFLMNPRGKIDGLLLTDGTQIKFPQHFSTKLTTIVSPTDEISVKGFSENKYVFNAESITNLQTNRTVGASSRYLNLRELEDLYGPAIPQPKKGINNHIGQKSMTAAGKIQAQLFDRQARVYAVILSDDSIVYFSSHTEAESNVHIDVGQTLSATGYGIENIFGKSFEADQLSNE